MNEHDATEIAFKNGYKQGKADGAREMINDVKEILLDYHLRENKKYCASTAKTKKQFDIETARYRAITNAVKFAITTLNETEKKYIGKDNNVPTNTEDMG